MITQNKINYKTFLNKKQTVKSFIEERNKILEYKQNQKQKVLYSLIINYKKYNNTKNVKICKTM